MSDEGARRRVTRGRPLRSVRTVDSKRSIERQRENARRGSAASKHRKPVQQIDWDEIIARHKATWDEMEDE